MTLYVLLVSVSTSVHIAVFMLVCRCLHTLHSLRHVCG